MNGKYFSLIVYSVMALFAIMAYAYVSELNTASKIHVYTIDFILNGNQSHMIFRFESKGGAFTTGDKIHVDVLLATDYSASIGKYVLLHFPQTLDPEQYDKIKNEENWALNQTNNSVQFSFPNRHFYQWSGTSLTQEFDLVYTQEGSQDAIFIIDDFLPDFDESGNLDYGNHVVLKNIITIEPSDVRLQIQSNNLIIGLTLLIITLTLATLYSKYDKLGIHIE